MISLERLATFLTLSECGSFTLTAKKHYCSQPTISHHIHQLEEQYGAPLILREGKTVRLTEEGRILREYASRIIALAQESEHKVKQHALNQRQVQSVYMSNYLSEYYFADILQQYYRDQDKRTLEIHSYCYNDLRHHLLEGRANYAIMPYYSHDGQLLRHFDTLPLFEEQLVLVISQTHEWRQRKLLYARDLNRQTILVAQSDYLREHIQEQLLRIRCRNTFQQTSNFGVIKKAVASGYGIAFLPYATVKSEIARGELAVMKVSGLAIHRENRIFIRKDTVLDERETSFIEQLREHFRATAPREGLA